MIKDKTPFLGKEVGVFCSGELVSWTDDKKQDPTPRVFPIISPIH